MKAVYISGQGEISLNHMWLPTWIGMNSQLKSAIEKDLQQKLCGLSMDDSGLDKAHEIVIEYLCQRFEIKGLRDYLDAMKFVETPGR